MLCTIPLSQGFTERLSSDAAAAAAAAADDKQEEEQDDDDNDDDDEDKPLVMAEVEVEKVVEDVPLLCPQQLG